MTGDAPIILIGAGGHGRVVLETCHAAGLEVAGFLDSVHPVGTVILGARVLGDNTKLEDSAFVGQHRFIVTIGHQDVRADISRKILAAGGELATAIHPSCVISPSADIGAGTVVIAGSIVNAGARIGRYCIVNTAATIDHDNLLEDGVQVCPGAHLAGNVSCGEGVFIGTGAAVIPNIKIGEKAVIGAGSVVIRDVAAGARVVGNPAG